jgi:hypothetical protein
MICTVHIEKYLLFDFNYQGQLFYKGSRYKRFIQMIIVKMNFNNLTMSRAIVTQESISDLSPNNARKPDLLFRRKQYSSRPPARHNFSPSLLILYVEPQNKTYVRIKRS